MSDAGFTKGPWHWVGNNYIDGPKGETVLECGDDGKNWGLHSAVLRVSDGDRALMIAAPDLLEALQEVFVIGDRLVDDVYGHEFVQKAKAAIAKALGR